MGELIAAIANQTLDQVSLSYDERTAATIFLVSKGYPEAYEKGKEIQLPIVSNNQVLLQAGTKLSEGKLLTNGGRVIAITALEDNLEKAIASAMKVVEEVSFDGKTYRKDIGQDLIKLQNEQN